MRQIGEWPPLFRERDAPETSRSIGATIWEGLRDGYIDESGTEEWKGDPMRNLVRTVRLKNVKGMDQMGRLTLD